MNQQEFTDFYTTVRQDVLKVISETKQRFIEDGVNITPMEIKFVLQDILKNLEKETEEM